MVGLLAARLIERPQAAVTGLAVGICIDLFVRLQALRGPGNAWSGVTLMFWPFLATILVLIVTLIFSFVGRKKQDAPKIP